jgi:hypothetical protein
VNKKKGKSRERYDFNTTRGYISNQYAKEVAKTWNISPQDVMEINKEIEDFFNQVGNSPFDFVHKGGLIKNKDTFKAYIFGSALGRDKTKFTMYLFGGLCNHFLLHQLDLNDDAALQCFIKGYKQIIEDFKENQNAKY